MPKNRFLSYLFRDTRSEPSSACSSVHERVRRRYPSNSLERQQTVSVPSLYQQYACPAPFAAGPATVETRETESGGRYVFTVETSLPLIGMLVAYRGWLLPERDTDGR